MKYILLLILAFPVMASGGHHGEDGKDGVNASTLYRGVAAALASSQHSFGFYTPKYQWSVASGHFDDKTAFSMGLGKRIGNVLINGSIVNESGEIGLGVGLSGTF